MARDSQAPLVARGAAKLIAADDGLPIGALAFDGRDTHANEGGAVGRLCAISPPSCASNNLVVPAKRSASRDP